MHRAHAARDRTYLIEPLIATLILMHCHTRRAPHLHIRAAQTPRDSSTAKAPAASTASRALLAAVVVVMIVVVSHAIDRTVALTLKVSLGL